jgi:hypothetical protein
MGAWFSRNLGDGILAAELLGRIEALFIAEPVSRRGRILVRAVSGARCLMPPPLDTWWRGM